jgi:hypothetical protein
MNKIFRKALTVLGSVAMVGATIGAAAAASTYPSPFTSNTAIVVGANAAPSDSIAASSIAADLDSAAVGSSMGGTTTVTGGDSYKFEKTSTKFHVGDMITGVISSALDEDELPELLADGIYVDDNNDEFDYTQSITMAASQLTMFEDNDYKADEPTVGFKINSASTVLSYNLSFSDQPAIADLETTELMLMGKSYYVLDAATGTLTLLDAATATIVAEGATETITAGGKSYSVGIEYIGETSAKLKVNGEITNQLSAGDTYKLKDGSYIGVKEILYSAKETGISRVEFSIGNGKLILTDGQDVEMNDDTIDGLTATVVDDGTDMEAIGLIWKADDELFITEDMTAVMPGFGAVQLVYGGLNFPAEEEIMVENSGSDSLILKNFPLKDSTEDIPLLYANGTSFVGIGKDADELLRTDNDGSITFDGDTDSYFVASYSDGRDAESYLMRATNFKVDNTVNKTTIQYRKNNAWVDAKVDTKETDTIDLGSVEMTVGAIDRLGKSVALTNASVGTSFNMLYSKEGMTVYLPYPLAAYNSANSIGALNLTASNTPTSFVLVFDEEDKDGDLGDGPTINATLGLNSQTPKEVEVSSYASGGTLAGKQEIDNSDVYRDFVYSSLATEIHQDQGPDQKTLKLIYHGEEVAADVYITSSESVVGGSSESGIMTVTDSQVSTVAGKNLIVVGGSAINSVAAELLGGAYSEAAFTSMTDVGAGSFLIQSFDRAGKTALLVAGYNAADTTKAATYLIHNGVDTSVGKKYIGATTTEATMVTTTA